MRFRKSGIEPIKSVKSRLLLALDQGNLEFNQSLYTGLHLMAEMKMNECVSKETLMVLSLFVEEMWPVKYQKGGDIEDKNTQNHILKVCPL